MCREWIEPFRKKNRRQQNEKSDEKVGGGGVLSHDYLFTAAADLFQLKKKKKGKYNKVTFLMTANPRSFTTLLPNE